MNEGWMKDEWRMMKDEECIMKDDDFKLLRGFGYGLTDICDCRVAFATENCIFYDIWQKGRGSKDQNQISEKNLNIIKVNIYGYSLMTHKEFNFSNDFSVAKATLHSPMSVSP